MNSIYTKNRLFIALKCLFFAVYILITGFTFPISNTSTTNDNDSILFREERRSLNEGIFTNDGTIKDPAIEILEEQPENMRYGVCHNYAISKRLGLKGQIPQTLPIVGQDDWYYIFKFIENYCQEVFTPQVGDLVTYHNDSTCPIIRHTGLVYDENIVESKWGAGTQVLAHPTFYVPDNYENHVKYYRIIKPVDEIIEDIKNKIPQCGYTKKSYSDYKQIFLHYAEQANNDKLWDILQRVMCIDEHIHNAANQSLLMIAAKTNNLFLAQIAVTKMRNINQQDKKGKTALHLAAKNDYSLIVPLLLKQELCDKNIKDNKGKGALDHLYEYQNLHPLEYVLKRMIDPTKTAKQNFWQTMNS